MNGKHALGDYIVFLHEGTSKRGYIVAYGETADAYLVNSDGVTHLVREGDITHD